MQVAKSLKGKVRGPALLSSRARNVRTNSVSPSVGHSVLHTAYLGKRRGPTRANASSVKAESGAGARSGATVDGDFGLAAKQRGNNNGTERKKKTDRQTHTHTQRERERERRGAYGGAIFQLLVFLSV